MALWKVSLAATDNKNLGTRQQILASDKFCEIGPAGACMADYSEHIAPKSPQKYRLGSNIFSELIVNQAFKLARSSQIGFPVPPCSGGSPDPPERGFTLTIVKAAGILDPGAWSRDPGAAMPRQTKLSGSNMFWKNALRGL